MIIRLLPTYIYLFMDAQNALPFRSNVQGETSNIDNSEQICMIPVQQVRLRIQM